MKKILLLTSILASTFFGRAQEVTTLAGSTKGYADGTGTMAQFNSPVALAVDAVGNIYVADTGNHRIRKITPAGVVSTLAGSSIAGTTDGTGTEAQFSGPSGIAIDGVGNIYVADQRNFKIRKITPAGVVSTFAGTTQGYADGTGTEAKFFNPTGVATDFAGNVYVTDGGGINSERIRKITPAGVVSTLAGSTQGYANGIGAVAKFDSLFGVTADATGNVYVSEYYHDRIRKIAPTDNVTTFAGFYNGYLDGPGIIAQFDTPAGLATDAFGNVYVADTGNSKIRKISPTSIVSTLAGSTLGYADGIGTAAQFNNHIGLATDAAGNVYVADTGNDRIRKITIEPLGIASYGQETRSFTAYPNPCRDLLKIQSTSVDVYSYRLCDMTGKLLLSDNYSSDINTAALAKGIYLLSLTSEGKTENIKVVKE